MWFVADGFTSLIQLNVNLLFWIVNSWLPPPPWVKKKPSIFYFVFSYLAATPAPVLAFCPPAMQSCVHTYHLPQPLAERRPRCHRWTQEPGSRLLLRLQVVIIWSLHFYPRGGLCCLYSKSSITHYQLTTVQLRGVKVRDEKRITIIINQDKSRVVWHDEMTIFCYIYICCWNRKRNDSRSMFGFSLKLWLNQTIKSLLWRKCWGKKSKSLTQSICFTEFGIAVIPVRLHGGLKNAEKLFPNWR